MIVYSELLREERMYEPLMNLYKTINHKLIESK